MPAREFPEPYTITFTGSRLVRWLLRQIGWQVRFEGLPALQGVVAVYPHTSNWDFVVLVLVKWAIGIPVQFWGKDKLFRVPLLGRWLRWLGGLPVDRTSPHGVVGQAVAQFARARANGEYLWLALTPEGTRRRIPGWRSGFYQTVLKTGVPLGLVRLDYGRREVTVLDFIRLSGEEANDFRRIAGVYQGVTGYNPHNASPIQLLAASVPRAETIVK